MTERATSSIGCDKFDNELDDFEDWVELFEKAVKLATNGTDLPKLYKEWLPLKLDKSSYAIFKQCDVTKTWDELKTELKNLLIDPTAKFQWQARLTTVTWDGNESFHALASRVKRAVNKYEKGMGDEYLKREYFFRFRDALPVDPYQDAIDVGIPTDKRTIENAKEMALRTQLTQVNRNRNKAVTLAGAAIHEDRAAGIEASLTGIATQLENIAAHNRKVDEKFAKFDERLQVLERRSRERSQSGNRTGFSSSRERYEKSRPSGSGQTSGPPAKSVHWPSSNSGGYGKSSSFSKPNRGGGNQRGFGNRNDRGRGRSSGNSGNRYHCCQQPCDCQEEEPAEDYRAIDTEDERDDDDEDEEPDVMGLAAQLASALLGQQGN